MHPIAIESADVIQFEAMLTAWENNIPFAEAGGGPVDGEFDLENILTSPGISLLTKIASVMPITKDSLTKMFSKQESTVSGSAPVAIASAMLCLFAEASNPMNKEASDKKLMNARDAFLGVTALPLGDKRAHEATDNKDQGG